MTETIEKADDSVTSLKQRKDLRTLVGDSHQKRWQRHLR